MRAHQRGVGPIVAVADVHLGLLAGERFYLVRNKSQCDALAFSDFVAWLQELETKGSVSVKRGKWGPPLLVRMPHEFILLGDYLELWDASDAAIDMSSRGIWNEMERLTCKKIYVVGNHDFASSKIEGRFPQGTSTIQILSNT